MVARGERSDSCKIDAHNLSELRSQLPRIAEKIIDSCNDGECYTHVDYEPIPSRECVIEIIDRLREILFPGYFTRGKLDPVNLKYLLPVDSLHNPDQISSQTDLIALRVMDRCRETQPDFA